MVSLSCTSSIQLFHFFENSVEQHPDNTALICDGSSLTYKELESRANQLAHYLIKNKISQGSIVAILLERSLESYLSILAVLKVGAAYVPIEVEYPDERVNYILGDLEFDAVLTSSSQMKRTGVQFPHAIVLDDLQPSLRAESSHRPSVFQESNPSESLCYVIYTSGSTGNPKGVEITHRSICHYIKAASDIYAMSANDRVYQGFSLAFDASLEEMWMAFANGATLVACTNKDTRSGVGLIEFLNAHQVTVFSTVPTLLASLDASSTSLRLLILGGEACTANLIKPWMRAGLKIMNTYGPTEATVIATYSECEEHKEITIGKPLPGYDVLILNEHLKPVSDGEVGELCIGGLGLARGYVNRPDLNLAKFIAHPVVPEATLYRTGDLAFVSASGDIQFAGRVDDQIKLRGFRIELNEIEAVIMQHQQVSQAVLVLQELDQPTLVAYVLLAKNASLDLGELRDFLRTKLPDYMMPSLFEEMEAFPLLASGKVNRKALPKPQNTVAPRQYEAPSTALESELVAVWEKALGQTQVSVGADFFYDLGGHSLLAAKVISALRKIPEFESISILDLYQNPSIKQLAEKIEKESLRKKAHEPKHATPKRPVSGLKYFLCGIGQFMGILLQYGLASWQFLIVVLCYAWVNQFQSIFSIEALLLYIGLVLAMPLIALVITISVKWLLLGRVKPGEYPLWGWFYCRWWFIQALQNNLLQKKYLTGTPIINLYFRLLGAKIGKNCFIATTTAAIPDVLTVGSGSTLGNGARVMGYVVEDGWLKIGTITIGKDCYVGARSVLNINTTMEDNSVLDEMSMLPSGMVIPKNQFYTGSPARETALPSTHITAQSKNSLEPSVGQTFKYGVLHYLGLVLILMHYYVSFLPSLMLLEYLYQNTNILVVMGVGAPLAAALFFVVHAVNVRVFKQIILPTTTPGVYPIQSAYYLRQWMVTKMLDYEQIGVLADSLFFPVLLRTLGAKIDKKVEMGEAPELIPDLLTVEDGGFAASGVAIAWPSAYKGLISYGTVTIGKNAFVGNVCLLPNNSSIGEGGLLGCMTVPPVDGSAAKSNTYWLGSPPMYLPKREIIGGFPDEVTYNPGKGLYLLRVVIEVFRVILPTTCSLILACGLFYVLDYLLLNTSLLTTALLLPVADLGINLLIVAGLIALKWALLGKIKPCIKPLWDVFIWKNDIREFSYGYYINLHLTKMVLGTPFVPMLYRAMGAKIGKRTYINTEGFAEFDLITIGDEVCINKETLIQTHLYEDRVFKVDQLVIQDGCNVGVGSMVLYNTVMEPNSTLGSLSLLMKGETLPANTYWEGSPAQCSSMASGFIASEVEDGVDEALTLQVVPVKND